MEQITVVIADDHTVFSDALAEQINRSKEFSVLYTVTDGENLLAKLASDEKNIPNIILMDIGMQPMGGIEATLAVSQDYPKVKVMALTSFDFANNVLKMIRVGAKGYFAKTESKINIVQAMHILQTTGFFYSEIVLKFIQDPTTRTDSKTDRSEIFLTGREIEFLRLASSDYTYEMIAGMMCVSERTVDSYREKLFKKFKVGSRAALVVKALLRGWRKK